MPLFEDMPSVTVDLEAFLADEARFLNFSLRDVREMAFAKLGTEEDLFIIDRDQVYVVTNASIQSLHNKERMAEIAEEKRKFLETAPPEPPAPKAPVKKRKPVKRMP